MVPLGQLRQPCLGWVSTDLNSEFTHFNLVIRLSKVQQLALPLCAFFENSRGSGRPRDPSDLHLSQREIVRNNQKLLFRCSFNFWHITCTATWQGDQAGTRFQVWSFSFWWLSGEVKHIVHLIRWNLKAVYANWGKTWPRSRQGNNARLLGI